MLRSLKRFASKKGVGLAGAGLLMFSLGVLLFVLQMRTTAEGQGSGNTRWEETWNAKNMYYTGVDGYNITWKQGAVPQGNAFIHYPPYYYNYWYWWWYYRWNYYGSNYYHMGTGAPEAVVTEWEVVGEVK